MSGPDRRSRPQAATNRSRARLWAGILALVALNGALVLAIGSPPATRIAIPYDEFRSQVLRGNVEEVSSRGATIQGELRQEIRWPAGEGGRTADRIRTERPTYADDGLLALLLREDVTVNAKPVDDGRSAWSFVLAILPTLLLVALVVWWLRRMSGGGGGALGGLGRSRARRSEGGAHSTTFADVAGIDEAKAELEEIVDFLKRPERYRRLGGMMPKGVLLTGPPGTGKTLLARALAGEAAVPFYSMSASEFVEMIVGVGASRVRDLFAQAKEDAPCIIFIDELDAIGRRREVGGISGGNDEREQTLNQILTEMDGFTGSEGVVVLAATNRPEILDAALLRAGRFDRRIAINPPDQQGRLQILRVHTRSVPLADPEDLRSLASETPGMVGADLRNLVNEAALAAARRDHDAVSHDDFREALERITLGAARRIILSEEDRQRTAYHEAGHALLGLLEPGADPVRKVSIIPRGDALGVTFQSPDADRYGYGERYLHGRIVGLLGGHAAEDLVYGETTTGAEADLEQATAIARQMVGRWGMSDTVGFVSALPRPDTPMHVSSVSPRMLDRVDDEVRRITEDAHERAHDTLRAHRPQLDALAAALLARETLDEAEIHATVQVLTPDPVSAPG